MPGAKQAWPIVAACWSPAMPRTGTARAEQRGIGRAELRGAVAHLRQHGARDAEQAQQVVVPVAAADVEQHGARGIGRIGRMHAPAGQAPQQEAVHRAEGERRRARPPPARRRRCPAARRAWWRRNRDRSSRPVRCGEQRLARPRRAAARNASAVRRSCQTMARCTARPVARSHSSVVSRWLVMPMPATSPRAGRRPAPARRAARPRRAAPDVLRLVLDPAGRGEVLRQLAPAPSARGTSAASMQDGAGGGGALVEGEQESSFMAVSSAASDSAARHGQPPGVLRRAREAVPDGGRDGGSP